MFRSESAVQLSLLLLLLLLNVGVLPGPCSTGVPSFDALDEGPRRCVEVHALEDESQMPHSLLVAHYVDPWKNLLVRPMYLPRRPVPPW